MLFLTGLELIEVTYHTVTLCNYVIHMGMVVLRHIVEIVPFASYCIRIVGVKSALVG